VLPALVVRFGGSNVLIGALGVVTWMGLFLPQIVASRYGQTLAWKKPWVIGVGIIQRFMILAIGLVILFLGSRHAAASLALFFGLYTVNQILMGIQTPVWFDFYAKLTPLERRGRLSGLRNSLAGTLAFLSGIILTWILGSFSFPLNHSLVFFLAFAFQFSSVAFQSRLVEEYPSPVVPRNSLSEYVRELPRLFSEDTAFRPFLIAASFLILAGMPLNFFTAYALSRFHATGFDVGRFTLIMVVGQIAGGLFNGFLSDRYGNKIALISAAAGLLVASSLAPLMPTLGWLSGLYFFIGFNLGSELMTRYNMAIEYGAEEHRAMYIGLMNTLLAPLYLSGFVGAWLSDRFGYPAVFIAGACCSLAAIGMLALRVREPRRSSERSV